MAIQIDGDGIGVSALSTSAKAELKSGRKNLIINGGFDVWQRGTSHTTNGYGSADRWYWHQSSASGTMSQQAFSYGQTDVSGNPKYYTRLAVTTGNNNNQLHQRLEDVSSLEAGTYTLSFWAKGTNPGGGTCESFIWFEFGSGGSTGFYVGTNPTYTVTSSWQKFSLTFTIPDLSSYTKGTNSYAMIGVFSQPDADTSTAAHTIDFANVQFEKGDIATDFEHRSYGEELALCQRYYYRLNGDTTNKRMALCGNYYLTYIYPALYFPTTMRTSPSMSFSSAGHFKIEQLNGGSQTVTNLTTDNSTKEVFTFSVQVGSNFSFPANLLSNGTSGWIGFDAEL